MILVVLGTQDKQFDRLLKDVDKLIDDKVINDKVVVQAGQTKYESKNMEIFDLIPAPEFEELLDKADLVITHGGAGTILSAIKKGKRIIAAPRLSKYMEHHNDHQKQIIGEFKKQGYLLEYNDGDDLGELIKESKKFKPKEFKSNTKNMIKNLNKYIDETDNVAWFHKYKEVISYLFFGGCTTLINIISYMLFRAANIDMLLSNSLAWVVSVLFAFITNKLFVFESRNVGFKKTMVECIYFFICRLLSLVFDLGFMYLLVDIFSCNELLSKIISNIIVIIINYILSKLLIFKKKR